MDLDNINYNSNVSSKEFIESFLEVFIDNLFKRWIFGKDPLRLVMIESNRCHICDKIKDNVWCELTDDFKEFLIEMVGYIVKCVLV